MRRDFFFLSLFLHSPPPSLPRASPSCPSPPSPPSYWEVFHEQLGPGRGEVSERGAVSIIQWLSGVCVCVCVHVFIWVCVCVCVLPSPSIGRCQVTGRPCHWLSAGFLLEQSHCSQHYHKLMRSARARLHSHTLIRSSDVKQATQTMSTPEQPNLKPPRLFSLSTNILYCGKQNLSRLDGFWHFTSCCGVKTSMIISFLTYMCTSYCLLLAVNTWFVCWCSW